MKSPQRHCWENQFKKTTSMYYPFQAWMSDSLKKADEMESMPSHITGIMGESTSPKTWNSLCYPEGEMGVSQPNGLDALSKSKRTVPGSSTNSLSKMSADWATSKASWSYLKPSNIQKTQLINVPFTPKAKISTQKKPVESFEFFSLPQRTERPWSPDDSVPPWSSWHSPWSPLTSRPSAESEKGQIDLDPGGTYQKQRKSYNCEGCR